MTVTKNVAQKLADVASGISTMYTPPIVGRLNFREVRNLPVSLLRTEEFFASNHTGSPCPCK